MIYLIIVSIIWAFSFGLIKDKLHGVDSNFISFARLAISFVFFSAFLRLKHFKISQILQLLILGAVQFGLMYILYIYSYNYLKAWQIALFTIFTPLYVTLINDILQKRFHFRFFLASVLAILGAGIIVFKSDQNFELQIGFILIQFSNLCFAIGQVYYKKIKKKFLDYGDIHFFAWLYTGALILSLINSLASTDYGNLSVTNEQILVLLYLGIISTGICFFLWNLGATKVNAGILAVMNNIKVPLGIAVAIFVFGESSDYLTMLVGLLLIVIALYVSHRPSVHKF